MAVLYWLIVIIRLLLPFAPANNGMENMFSAVIHRQEQASEPTPIYKEDTDAIRSTTVDMLEEVPVVPEASVLQERPSVRSETAAFVLQNLPLFWLCIALILFVQRWTRYRSFMKFIRAGSFLASDEELLAVYQEVCGALKVRRPPEVYLNKTIVSPMFTGVLHPAIHLPRGDFSRKQLGYIFRHELIHYKRGDVLYKWLLEGVRCIHWFNPMVYMVVKEINRQCELSCDEQIIGELPRKDKQIYGDTLIAAIKDTGNYLDNVAVVTMNENVKLLKERLESIMKHTKQTKFSVVLSLMLVLLLSTEAVYAGAYVSPFKRAKAVVDAQLDKVVEGPNSMRQDGQIEQGTADKLINKADSNSFNVNTEDGIYRFATISSHLEDGYIIVVRAANFVENNTTQVTIGSGDNTFVVNFTEETKAYISNPSVLKGIENIFSQLRYKQWKESFRDSVVYLSVTEVNGPYAQTPDELARELYEESNIALFQAVVEKIGSGAYNDLVNKSVEDSRIAFFSVLMDKGDTTFDYDSMALKLYEKGSISFFSVIQSNVSNGTKTALLDRSMAEGKISFFSVLLDDSLGLDYYKYAKQAYDSNKISFFSVVSNNLSDAERLEFLNKAYNDDKISFFSVLLNDDMEGLDVLRQRAYNDKKTNFFYMLWD